MKLGYTVLYVKNVLETVALYEKAFGLSVDFIHESNTYAQMSTGDVALGFAAESVMVGNGFEFHHNRQGVLPSGFELTFVTEDVQAAYEKAVAGGALPHASPELKWWGRVVGYVKDNNGILVEICSPSVRHKRKNN